MGLTPTAPWLAVLHAVRNQRILAAWNARQAESNRRAAAGLPAQNTQTPAENHPRQPQPAGVNELGGRNGLGRRTAGCKAAYGRIDSTALG